LLLAVKAQHETAAYPSAKIKITGYDPRDILYGHYLMFRYEWNWAEAPENYVCDYGDCCLCMGEGEDNPPVTLMTCKAAKEPQACTNVVTVNYLGGTEFRLDNDRYLVSETRARELEVILRDEP